MNNIARYLMPALLIAAFISTPALAQTTSAGGYKIGVVDMDRLREDHQWLKDQYKELDNLLKKLEKEIEPLLKEIEDIRTKITEGRDTLSSAEKLALQNQFQAKTVEHQNEIKARQLTIDEKEIEVNKEAYADIQKVIAELAKEENYHLILKAQNSAGSQVLFFNNALDITSEVVERLNKLKK